jgi:hypothetical protein
VVCLGSRRIAQNTVSAIMKRSYSNPSQKDWLGRISVSPYFQMSDPWERMMENEIIDEEARGEVA